MRWRGMTCALLFAGVLVFGIAGVIAYCSMRTEKTIERLGRIVEELGGKTPVSVFAGGTMEELPSPVRRYFTYVFRGEPRNVSWVRVEMAGQFRRPRTETFSRTTASQILAAGTPAFVFDATTPVVPGIWARAYDSFAEGRMEMKAKIASAFTVVDERETEALNRTSLRRWLLESPLCPPALLPGGPVRWEPIDDHHARAVVAGYGLEASLVATFRDDGSLESFSAEEDGDLETPYHGSGEHVSRSDYRLVEGMMIPMAFSISRVSGGCSYPFWTGCVVSIVFGDCAGEKRRASLPDLSPEEGCSDSSGRIRREER